MIHAYEVRRRLAYRAAFAGKAGRHVLHDLMRRNGVLATSQVDGDPCRTAFNEGRRAAVLDILSILRMREEDLQKLAMESVSDDD